jgi:hypothetical protein
MFTACGSFVCIAFLCIFIRQVHIVYLVMYLCEHVLCWDMSHACFCDQTLRYVTSKHWDPKIQTLGYVTSKHWDPKVQTLGYVTRLFCVQTLSTPLVCLRHP